jgi:hypothetical protein
VIVLDADNEFVAAAKAEKIGKESEHEYTAVAGGKVSWVFHKVGNVHKIDADNLGDNTEVFSRFLRDKDVKSILTTFD